MPHGSHVASKGSSAERRRFLLHALGQFLKTLGAFLAFLWFVGHFPIPGLNSFLFHGQRPVHLQEMRKSGSCRQNDLIVQKWKYLDSPRVFFLDVDLFLAKKKKKRCFSLQNLFMLMCLIKPQTQKKLDMKNKLNRIWHPMTPFPVGLPSVLIHFLIEKIKLGGTWWPKFSPKTWTILYQ